jgi:hypothetical protein
MKKCKDNFDAAQKNLRLLTGLTRANKEQVYITLIM